ncbi:MAG: hypothetical protein Q7R43_01775 [Candidatus Daviesbacteria bacterium]|nr:hypothetical protein [Candidatus Daviesbacteria bacterium]
MRSRRGLGFVEIFEKVINSDYQKMLEDGVHGNALGHEFIFEEVKDYLINNKILNF